MQASDGDGTYTGYFTRGGKKVLCEAQLRWRATQAGWVFEGPGVDSEGTEFRLSGTAETMAPCRITLSRDDERDGGRGVAGEGFREKAGFAMFGSAGGSFSLRPSSEGPKMRTAVRAKLAAELCDMGFDLEAAGACVEAGMSKEQAIEQLTRGEEKREQDVGGGDGGGEDKVACLVAMGFDRERAREALLVMDGDLAAAIDYCTNDD